MRIDTCCVRIAIVTPQMTLIDVNARATESIKALQTRGIDLARLDRCLGTIHLAIVGVACQALVALTEVGALGVDTTLGFAVTGVGVRVAFVDVVAKVVVHLEALAAYACVGAECVLADGAPFGACRVVHVAFVDVLNSNEVWLGGKF